jgi:hypothetical protein
MSIATGAHPTPFESIKRSWPVRIAATVFAGAVVMFFYTTAYVPRHNIDVDVANLRAVRTAVVACEKANMMPKAGWLTSDNVSCGSGRSVPATGPDSSFGYRYVTGTADAPACITSPSDHDPILLQSTLGVKPRPRLAIGLEDGRIYSVAQLGCG